MDYKEIDGDLIQLALQGEFDVIAHGCNCFCTMGAGIAPQMAKAFGCDKFVSEHQNFKGDINKLGVIDYKSFNLFNNQASKAFLDRIDNKPSLFVVNAYTQYHYGANHKDGVKNPLDYEALRLCLRKINHIFKGKHIGLPKIGCGLAGGVWDYTTDTNIDKYKFIEFDTSSIKDVRTIIQEELKDMNITIVNYKK